MLAINQVYLGDCKNYFKQIEDNSIDCVFTDPPYNIADKGKLTKVGEKVRTNEAAWGYDFKDSWKTLEEYINWLLPITQEFFRILKDNGTLLMFLDRKLTGYIALLLEEQGYKYRNKLYFEKLNPVPQIRKNYRSTIEEAIWMTKDKYTFHFLEQNEMKQLFSGFIGQKTSNHPTEKYPWMIEPLIVRHTNEKDVILDAFAGSGSVVKACQKYNRNFIAIEKEKKYYKRIAQDIEAYNSQLRLFK